MDGRPEFGKILKRLRIEAGLSQEALAERARISAQAVSSLERGARRVPYRDTVELLATALGLNPAARAELEGAADRRRGPKTAVLEEPPQAGRMRAPLTPLIGREADLARLDALMHRSDVRLVTLTGPGGIGKTRLALAAAEAAGDFEARPLLVSLAAIREPRLVESAIASTAGVRSAPGRSTLDVLRGHFGDRSLLLVLDNFEQIVDAAPLVLDLLQACPGLKVLVTSRAPLRVRGEVEFPVAPLHSDEAAIELFLDRARSANPLFTVNAANAATVAEICRRLDRLPLALELAAPQVRLWSPEVLLARMQRRLDVLVGGAKDLPERQQTMRRTIEWSYGLLDAGEQAMLGKLSVFAGGFDLDLIEAVCGPPEANGPAALDTLAALHEKGLLQRADSWDERTRLSMLETIREFALERLAESGGLQAAVERHTACMSALAHEADTGMRGPASATWMRRIDVELDNIRAALQRARSAGDGERGIRIALGIERYWERRGLVAEGRAWTDAFLAQPDAQVRWTPETYLKGILGAGLLALRQNDFIPAVALLERGLALAAEAGDEFSLARANMSLGMAAQMRGDYAATLVHYERAMPQWRAHGDVTYLIAALNNYAAVLFDLDKLAEAAALFDECIGLARGAGNVHILGMALGNRGAIDLRRGDFAAAERVLLESLGLLREAQDRFGMVSVFCFLGECAEGSGDLQQAEEQYLESLRLNARFGVSREMVAQCLEGLARLADTRELPHRALLLATAAGRERELCGAPGSPKDQEGFACLRERLRARLPGAAFARALDEAARRSVEDVVSEVIAQTREGGA